MKRKIILDYLLSAFLGGALAFGGITVLTFNFWLILIISQAIKVNYSRD